MNKRFRAIVSTFIKHYTVNVQENTLPTHEEEFIRRIFLQIGTQGRNYDSIKTTTSKLEGDKKFSGWKAQYFLTHAGKDLLSTYLVHKNKTKSFLKQCEYIHTHSPTIWLQDLYSGKISMGLKSDDDFLKGCGYFDRVPIDRFYPPFLLRTGILMDYIKQTHIDPGVFTGQLTDKKTYHAYTRLIITLCKNSLDGLQYQKYDLAKNPGIVDLFIWTHCASSDTAKNMCGIRPKCHQCPIQQDCDYGGLLKR